MQKKKLRLAALSLVVTSGVVATCSAVAEELTPDVATSLISAENHIKSKQFKVALSEIGKASKEAKTDNDKYIILQTQSALYSTSGDNNNALRTDTALYQSPKATSSEKKAYLSAIVGLGYKVKNYSACKNAALSLLNIEYTPMMATMAVQCPYVAQDWEQVTRIVPTVQNLAHKHHADKVPESIIQMDAVAQGKLKKQDLQEADYLWLLANYPSKQYWDLSLHGMVVETDLTPRMTLALNRLRYATHTLPSDMVRDMLEQAIQLQLPLLAHKLSPAMGNIPKKTSEDIRFQKFVVTQADTAKASLAQDHRKALESTTAGPLLVVGYELVLNGNTKDGLSLMRLGLTKNPKHPNEAKLNYALAEMDAGMYSQAQKDLNNVPGNGPSHRLGKLWSIFLHNQHR